MNITKDNVWMITLVVLIAAFIVFVTWESPQNDSSNPQIVTSSSPPAFAVESFGGCDTSKANPNDAIAINAKDEGDGTTQIKAYLEEKYLDHPDWKFDFRLALLGEKCYDLHCIDTGISSEIVIFDITSFCKKSSITPNSI